MAATQTTFAIGLRNSIVFERRSTSQYVHWPYTPDRSGSVENTRDGFRSHVAQRRRPIDTAVRWQGRHETIGYDDDANENARRVRGCAHDSRLRPVTSFQFFRYAWFTVRAAKSIDQLFGPIDLQGGPNHCNTGLRARERTRRAVRTTPGGASRTRHSTWAIRLGEKNSIGSRGRATRDNVRNWRRQTGRKRAALTLNGTARPL